MNTKKFTITAGLILGSILTVSAVGLYIPQITENNIRLDALNDGEAAYIVYTNSEDEVETTSKRRTIVNSQVSSENIATLYIGNGTKNPYKVVDNGALRGVRQYRTLDITEYGIATDDHWTTDGNGTYSMTSSKAETYMVGTNTITGLRGTLTIMVPAKYVINKVTYDSDFYSNVIIGDFHEYQTNIDNSEDDKYVINITEIKNNGNASPYCKISNIKVYVYDLGENYYVNDTSNRTFLVRDQEGTYNLYNLRNELYHKYDGNRGQDWSNWIATNDIQVMGNRVMLTKSQDAYIQCVTNGGFNNIFISLKNQVAAEFKEHNSGIVYGGELKITAINFNDVVSTFTEPAILTYYQSITKDGVASFDPSQLRVLWTDHLEHPDGVGIEWKYLTYNVDYTVTDLGDGTGTVSIPWSEAMKKNKGFFMLQYGDKLSDIIRIEFNVPVYINKGLFLKGEDGVIYKITVNAGVISATAQ